MTIITIKNDEVTIEIKKEGSTDVNPQEKSITRSDWEKNY